MQRAADERLRPPRLHDGGAADLQDPRCGQRHDRRALAALECPQQSGSRARAAGRAPDLPDRVRRPEPSQQAARRPRLGAGRIRRQGRTDRLRQRARGRVLAVPARGRSDRWGARSERQRRDGRLPDRPGVRQRPAQAALLRLAASAGGQQAPSRLLAVGPRAPRGPGHDGDRAGAPQGILQLPHAAHRAAPTPRATGP